MISLWLSLDNFMFANVALTSFLPHPDFVLAMVPVQMGSALPRHVFKVPD